MSHYCECGIFCTTAVDLGHEKVSFFAAAKTPHFSNPKTLKRHFSFFNSSTVNLPMLEALTCWSEPLLWVRNFLYHCSGLETWKNFFHSWFFSASKIPPFSNPETGERHFFQFVDSRFTNARSLSLLEWAIIVIAELLVPLQWTWDIKNPFSFFSAAKIPPLSNPKTLKRHFAFFNSSTVQLPMIEAQACRSEPLFWVWNFKYHCSGLMAWKNFFHSWCFSGAKIPLFSNPKTLKPHFSF